MRRVQFFSTAFGLLLINEFKTSFITGKDKSKSGCIHDKGITYYRIRYFLASRNITSMIAISRVQSSIGSIRIGYSCPLFVTAPNHESVYMSRCAHQTTTMAARAKLSAKGRVWHNGKELSEDLKRLIVAELIEEGANSFTGRIPDNVSLRKISGKFRLHHTTISNTWRKFVQSQSFEPRRRGQGNCSKLDFDEIQLIEHLKLAKP